MDSILFYGERDEATRRQVRSAAASHSHRIGPRKPKAGKQHARASSGQVKKRDLKSNGSPTAVPMNAPISANPTSPNIVVFKNSTAPGYTAANIERKAVKPQSISPTVKSSSSDLEEDFKPHAAYARWDQSQAMQQRPAQTPIATGGQQSAARNDLKSPPRPTQTPGTLPCPLSFEAAERPSSATSMSSPQASPASPSSRLPQYSWTEYPRYGVGRLSGSLQTSGKPVITERQHHFELPPPPTSIPPPKDTPGFRPYGMEVSETPRSQPQ